MAAFGADRDLGDLKLGFVIEPGIDRWNWSIIGLQSAEDAGEPTVTAREVGACN